MVRHVVNQNAPRYPENLRNQNQHFSPPVLSRFHFESNQGSPSSREPNNNIQRDLSNSNGVILTYSSLQAGKRCSVRIGVLRNFAKFIGKHLC